MAVVSTVQISEHGRNINGHWSQDVELRPAPLLFFLRPWWRVVLTTVTHLHQPPLHQPPAIASDSDRNTSRTMSSQQNAELPPRPRAAATTSTRQSEAAAKAPIDSEARARLVANLTDREIAELKKYLTPELTARLDQSTTTTTAPTAPSTAPTNTAALAALATTTENLLAKQAAPLAVHRSSRSMWRRRIASLLRQQQKRERVSRQQRSGFPLDHALVTGKSVIANSGSAVLTSPVRMA